MNTWKVILATIVIFTAGVVTGALLVRFAAHPRSGPGGMRLEFLRRMERDLNLSADQQQRIDKILKEGQEQTRKIMEPVAPALHAELQRIKDEFRQVLTPEQQSQFDQLLKHPQRGGRDGRRPLNSPETSSLSNAPQTSPAR